ncbi:MAG TPA: flagellar assembly protein FliW [Bryobacteraceae bacterium]|nr:flagellar assembly protein FliW [Bryobacteraceae bacterium]
MPSCQTRYFGTAEYQPDAALVFPQALPGFIEETEFVLLQRPADFPLTYLQSTRTPGLCFLTIPVLSVDPDYCLELTDEDACTLGVPAVPEIGKDVLCLALISLHTDEPTANLFAPLVISLATRVAGQCFQTGSQYSHQHPVLQAEKGMAA